MDVNGQKSDIKVSSHQITGGYCLYDEGGPKIRFGEWQYFLPVKLKKRIWLFVYDLRKNQILSLKAVTVLTQMCRTAVWDFISFSFTFSRKYQIESMVLVSGIVKISSMIEALIARYCWL